MDVLSSAPEETPPPLRIGVLIHAPVQLLDLAPIDLFGMLTRDYLAACNLPAPLVKFGIPVEIQYISSIPLSTADSASTSTPSPTLSSSPPPRPTPTAPALAEMTASAAIALTTDIASPAVAPGTLDIILIPGPDPRLAIPDAVGEWIRAHYEHGSDGRHDIDDEDDDDDHDNTSKHTPHSRLPTPTAVRTTLMSVCTGIFVLAHSGVLSGHEATGPRALLGELRRRYGAVRWVEGVRWVRSAGRRRDAKRGGKGGGKDKRNGKVNGNGNGKQEGEGRIWTSGGITNGLDMVAAYVRERYPGPLSETVCMLADVGDRGQGYRTGKVLSNGLWLWAILRAWWWGK